MDGGVDGEVQIVICRRLSQGHIVDGGVDSGVGGEGQQALEWMVERMVRCGWWSGW